MTNTVHQSRCASQCCPHTSNSTKHFDLPAPIPASATRNLTGPVSQLHFEAFSIFHYRRDRDRERRASIINKARCIKPYKLLCIMVNRIHQWLSGKEKYGRHYCLAGTGFAGQPRVLSGSEYKSKTEDERRLRRYGPQRNN